MHAAHSADALDHWKGALIKLLRAELKDLRVVPMFTDQNMEVAWTENRVGLYAWILGVHADEEIIHSDVRMTNSKLARENYFGSIGSRGDLFLDPDNGIALKTSTAKHLRCGDIEVLLDRKSSKRVLLIYQHLRGANPSKYIERVQEELNWCQAFAYKDANACLIFLSRSGNRLKKLRSILAKRYGDAIQWEHRLTNIT